MALVPPRVGSPPWRGSQSLSAPHCGGRSPPSRVTFQYIGSPRVPLLCLKARIKSKQHKTPLFVPDWSPVADSRPTLKAVRPLGHGALARSAVELPKESVRPLAAECSTPSKGSRARGVAKARSSAELVSTGNSIATATPKGSTPTNGRRALPPMDSEEKRAESARGFTSSAPSRGHKNSVSLLPPIETELEAAEGKSTTGTPPAAHWRRRAFLKRRATELGVKGGRSVSEVLKRNQIQDQAFEGFSQEEVARMRRAFRLYRPADTAEVDTADVHDILAHLGYINAADEIDAIIKEVSEFTTFDFHEVVQMVEKYSKLENMRLRAVFDQHCRSNKSKLHCEDLIEVLNALGIVALRATVDEVLQETGYQFKMYFEYDDFEKFLAVYRVTEGFGHEDIALAQKVFRAIARPPSHKSGDGRFTSPPYSPAGDSEIKVSQLAEALQQMLGPHVAHHVDQFVDQLRDSDTELEITRSIGFHDFLIFYRRLHGAVVKELQDRFQRADANGSGVVPTSALAELISGLGFTLFPAAVGEFLSEADTQADSVLTFDEFVVFVKVCRKRSGFRHCDVEQFSTVFSRFDPSSFRFDDSNPHRISSYELLDLLRYFGYAANIEDVRCFLSKGRTDSNPSRSIDFSEFLWRMRYFVEGDIRLAHKVFDANAYSDCKEEMGSDDLGAAMAAMSCVPHAGVLEGVVRDRGDQDSLDFEAFYGVANECRQRSAAEKRKRAGFSEVTCDHIQMLFKSHCREGREFLEKGELLWLLTKLGVPVTTAEERKHIFDMLHGAREAARLSGVDVDVDAEGGSTCTTFWVLLHLFRALSELSTVSAREEEEAIDLTNFTWQEVQDFRSVFNEWVASHRLNQSKGISDIFRPNAGGDRAKGGSATRTSMHCGVPRPSPQKLTPRSASKTLPVQSLLACDGGAPPMDFTRTMPNIARASPLKSASLVCDAEEELMSIGALKELIQSTGIDVESKQLRTLESKARENSRREDASINFANFLLLMHFLLDTNFGNIKSTTETLGSRLRKFSGASFEKKSSQNLPARRASV